MTDTPELNVSALAAQICGCADRPQHIRDCALIRDYGDKRYQQAIADVVEWLRSGDAFALTDHEAAQEITRRFEKGQDQNPVK